MTHITEYQFGLSLCSHLIANMEFLSRAEGKDESVRYDIKISGLLILDTICVVQNLNDIKHLETYTSKFNLDRTQ